MLNGRGLVLGASILATFSSSCSDPASCDACDAPTQRCEIQQGCRFLQNGNPNLFGDPTTASCFDLPTECLEDRTCLCVFCGPAETRDPSCVEIVPRNCSDDDEIITQGFTCE